ncbi:MAG: rRNA pseudouridine synthase, partial [Oscillospiraceae bacterium]|nr:rRNA pseudouridine synthase [Oscillospiraceae bacterium]
MMERIQKILSAAGICSRRQAEQYILAGRVLVNGVTAKLGDQADIQCDRIEVDGQPIQRTSEKLYLMLNKPRGYVTTLSDERGRPTVAELVSDCGERVYPVGRLDMDSDGLLLFTNDGDFAQRLMHPSHGMEKEYHVTVGGDLLECEKRLSALTA